MKKLFCLMIVLCLSACNANPPKAEHLCPPIVKPDPSPAPKPKHSCPCGDKCDCNPCVCNDYSAARKLAVSNSRHLLVWVNLNYQCTEVVNTYVKIWQKDATPRVVVGRFANGEIWNVGEVDGHNLNPDKISEMLVPTKKENQNCTPRR